MLSRRNIRIKVLQQLYAFQQQEGKSVPEFRKNLDKLFRQFYQFYYFNIRFILDFHVFLESEKEIELEKYFPNRNQIRKTEMLKRTGFFQALEKDEHFTALSSKLPYDWKKHGDLFNKLFIDLTQYDFFIAYNTYDEPEPAVQKEFLIQLFEFLFNEFELFSDFMEDEYLYWEDDSADILKALVSTITGFYDKNRLKIEEFSEKQMDDARFGFELFEQCVANRNYLDGLIQNQIANWDSDRLTVNDIILMRMALCEFLYFETIPPKVTINEYLDIAKAYSTPKSHLFLNGVLDKIRMILQQEGRMNKSGRGLKNE